MKVLTHNRRGSKKRETIKNWKISDNQKKKLLMFLSDYETGKITRKTPTNSEALIERLCDYLKFGLSHLDMDNLKPKDTELFFDKLYKDKFKSCNKKPYALKTKIMILSTITKYIEWLHPNKPELTKPLKIFIKSKKRDVVSLRLEDIDALYKGCKNARERYFIAVLFSSGARAEEFHNLRFSDVELPEGKDSFVKIRLREEFSKTEGRTISLYYKHSLDAVREFLEERKKQKILPEDVVFPFGYDAQRKFLRILGKRVLKRSLNYHLFRHTCASWLASKLNRQQLCIFFGWRFSSSMPDVYIKRDGVDMDAVTKAFSNTQIEELQSKIEVLEDYKKKMDERIIKIDTQLKRIVDIDKAKNILSSTP